MHTNIVTLLDAGLEPQDFIVMELLDGVDASTLARRTGRLTLHHTIGIVAPICDALHYAHDQHVIHGDVSDSNILLRQSDGVPKLADFGLACHTGEIPIGRPGRVTGTPGYIAPELLDGAVPSARSDLYSLAAVVQRLLVGPADYSPAQRGTTVPVAGTSACMPLAKERPDLPRGVTDAVEQALSPEPAARQASVAEFHAQLTRERLEPLIHRGAEGEKARRQRRPVPVERGAAQSA